MLIVCVCVCVCVCVQMRLLPVEGGVREAFVFQFLHHLKLKAPNNMLMLHRAHTHCYSSFITSVLTSGWHMVVQTVCSFITSVLIAL